MPERRETGGAAMDALRAEIDATGDIEDTMIAAARRLVEEFDYSLSDLGHLLAGALEEEANDV